jgi:hypothetical protein
VRFIFEFDHGKIGCGNNVGGITPERQRIAVKISKAIANADAADFALPTSAVDRPPGQPERVRRRIKDFRFYGELAGAEFERAGINGGSAAVVKGSLGEAVIEKNVLVVIGSEAGGTAQRAERQEEKQGNSQTAKTAWSGAVAEYQQTPDPSLAPMRGLLGMTSLYTG